MSHGVSSPAASKETEWARSFEGTPYQYVRLLGRGGMGVVIEAEHVTLGTRVAVKLLHEELSSREDLVDRLRLEAQTLARLAHPNVVRVTDLGRTRDGRAFYVMEKLDGVTLRAELDARGALSVEESVGVIRAMLEGLAAAHAMGIVHRDVKPENVFLTARHNGVRMVKILDFGIAKVLAESASVAHAPSPLAYITREDLLLGTPSYLAPEQISGGVLSPAIDVYACALVLYRMLTGRHPFEGRTRDAVLRAHLDEMPKRPRELMTTPIPPALEALVMRALAKEPRDRPRDAQAFIDALVPGGTPKATPLARPVPDSTPYPAPAETAVTLRRDRAPQDPAVLFAPNAVTAPATPLGAMAPIVPIVATAPVASMPVASAPIASTPVASAPTASEAPRTSARNRSSERWMGVLCLLVSMLSFVLRIHGLMFALAVRRDPRAMLLETFQSVPEGAEALVVGIQPATCARHGLLLLSSLLLAAVGVDLLRLGQNAAARLRAWSGFAAICVSIAIVLDFAVLTPAQQALAELVSPASTTVASVSLAVVVGSAVIVAVAELAWVLVCFVVGHRSMRGSVSR